MGSPGLSSREHLRRLHPASIGDPSEILGLLRRLRREKIPLKRGLSRSLEREVALVDDVTDAALVLAIRGGWITQAGDELLLGFELEGRPYFFASDVKAVARGTTERTVVNAALPPVIFFGERRERLRSLEAGASASRWKATLVGPAGQRWPAQIADSSPGGLGMLVSGDPTVEPGQGLRVEMTGDGEPSGGIPAEVRYRRPDPGSGDWVKIGLRIAPQGPRAFKEIDTRTRAPSFGARLRTRAGEIKAGARVLAARAFRSGRRDASQLGVVEFRTGAGERIVGLVDSTGDPRGAPAVIIPPAWGKTKETLLPLARTLVAMFEGTGQPLVVLRFDGVRRRGESHTDPWCKMPGREHHSFTISQGVRDIAAAAQFLAESEQFGAKKIVLVTFSASAIEGRRALAQDGGNRIVGWVPVVAPPDLQSAMRVVSGGLDFLAGAERGLKFGMREVLGIEIDVDRANSDAIEHKLGFLEDACRDFSGIDQPVSWIHGAYDGWMDLARVRTVLAFGRQDNRKLIVVPTGHQLRNSRQALDVFTIVGSEIASIVECQVERAIPDLLAMEARRRAERGRLPERKIDLASFWHDYLLGRDGHPGMSLMTRAPSYTRLMATQVDRLGLRPGDVVADLGSGLGAFAEEVARREDAKDVGILEIDLISDALRVHAPNRESRSPRRDRVSADLSSSSALAAIPLADDTCSAVLASLLISYVGDPEKLLRDVLRVLRPGGRFVVSTLRRDADLSLIWAENEKSLRADHCLDQQVGTQRLDDSLRSFFNDASRLMLLEEDGLFRFWEPQELADLVSLAGFVNVTQELALGQPPQAVVVAGTRP